MSNLPFKSVCVFCGSGSGADAKYAEAAEAFGEELVRQKIKLVYGGGDVGLMGTIARTVVAGLGDEGVVGVIPEALSSEELSGKMNGTTIVVPDMHTRKAKMAELCEAFVALPGGFGTMEELLEVITWAQIGYHKKPIGILNVGGYYDKLLEFFDTAVEERFIRPHTRQIVQVADSPSEMINLLAAYKPPPSLIQQEVGLKGT